MRLSANHRKTLAAVFERPVRSDVEWSSVERLFVALGVETSEGRGSRVRVYLNGMQAVFHWPHPRKEADRGALRSVRTFLKEAGTEPEG